METLGSRLKESRERKGFTQVQVAEKLGISNGTLSGYERNYRDPDTNTLTILAKLYGVSTDYLTTGKESGEIHNDSDIDNKRKEIMKIINNTNDIKEIELTLDVVKRMLGK